MKLNINNKYVSQLNLVQTLDKTFTVVKNFNFDGLLCRPNGSGMSFYGMSSNLYKFISVNRKIPITL